MKRYKCVSVYGWYTKVIKKFETKNYGIQSAIQKFWYMSGIQAKKSRMKSYTDLFFCCVPSSILDSNTGFGYTCLFGYCKRFKLPIVHIIMPNGIYLFTTI